MSCCVATGDVVKELTLDIGEQSRGSNPEELIVQPLVTKLLFDKDKPSQSVLGSPDSTGWLKAHDEASSLVVVANGSTHYL